MEQAGKTNQPRKPRRTPEEINSILLAYESSGLSSKEFCKLHQIQTLYLKRWLKRYRNTKQAKGFVEYSQPQNLPPLFQGCLPNTGVSAFYQPVEPSYFKASGSV